LVTIDLEAVLVEQTACSEAQCLEKPQRQRLVQLPHSQSQERMRTLSTDCQANTHEGTEALPSGAIALNPKKVPRSFTARGKLNLDKATYPNHSSVTNLGTMTKAVEMRSQPQFESELLKAHFSSFVPLRK
jgi:hypothetical protein